MTQSLVEELEREASTIEALADQCPTAEDMVALGAPSLRRTARLLRTAADVVAVGLEQVS